MTRAALALLVVSLLPAFAPAPLPKRKSAPADEFSLSQFQGYWDFTAAGWPSFRTPMRAWMRGLASGAAAAGAGGAPGAGAAGAGAAAAASGNFGFQTV